MPDPLCAFVGQGAALTAAAWAAAAAFGLSILAMYLTGTFHPPAGINPLLAVSGNLPWTFLFAPVLAGALLHELTEETALAVTHLRTGLGYCAAPAVTPAGRRARSGQG